jgi:thioredoxin 1
MKVKEVGVMAEIVVNDSNFESEVINSDIPVLVDFWAEWCGPCRMLSPVVSAIAVKYEGKLKVCKVNVDEAMEVAEQYFISSIPAVKFFKGGEVVNESIGFVPQQKLEDIIEGII